MALQSSGTITLKEIASEFSDSAPHGLKEFYSAASGIPSSGTITIKDFYGSSSVVNVNVTFLAIGGGGGAGTQTNTATGAGGAGGVLHGTISVPEGTYSATIGNGGSADSNGGDTTFTIGSTTYTAYGGGGGGAGNSGAGAVNGRSGGSGGGGGAGGSGGASIQTSMGGLTGYGNAGDAAGTPSSADSSAGGGGAGSAAIPGSHANKGSFPVQFGMGGDPITLSGYEVAGGGQMVTGAGNWYNAGARGISPSQAYSAPGSSTGYGDGGSLSGSSGSAGRLIIIGTNTKNMSASGSFTVNADGSIS